MVEEPLISIVIPVYNGSKYLTLAVESCLNQTYQNLEVIIVDDGSTDDSLLIAKELQNKDKRIKLISNGQNKTLPVSLNIGHRAAVGEFITWTSDDNIFQKDAIKRLYSTLIEENVDIVYSNYVIIDADGIIVDEARLNNIEYLLLYGVIGACFLYKKEVYRRNNGYNENLFLVEDYDFWLRALKHSNYYRLNISGYYFYRYHKNSLSTRMVDDSLLKEQYINKLGLLYSNLFDHKGIKNKEGIIRIIINRLVYGPNKDVQPIKEPYFFNDLKIVASSFRLYSFKNIKMIFLEDAVETILKNKKFQNFKILFALHSSGKMELMNLPINRYFAVIKKCIF